MFIKAVLTGIDDTSFYQDTFIDPYYDPENSYLYGDSLITNHRLKKTRPLYVNYAKVAKRVDVKKLKENLWKVLTATQVKRKKIRASIVLDPTDAMPIIARLLPPLPLHMPIPTLFRVKNGLPISYKTFTNCTRQRP